MYSDVHNPILVTMKLDTDYGNPTKDRFVITIQKFQRSGMAMKDLIIKTVLKTNLV
jgi:uncharacterized membrane protein